MKKIFRITAVFIAAIFLLSSCMSGEGIVGTGEPTQDSGTSPSMITELLSTAASSQTSNPEDSILNNSAPETLKILAVGNSFSIDGMQYLFNIAQSAGVKNIILGNLYIGGCSLQTHLANSKSGAAAYTYYKNTTGSWVAQKDSTLLDGLLDEEWDFITMQQSSPNSGIPLTYGKTLSELISFVKANKTNPDAKLVWHMTWAYQNDSTHTGFAAYDRSQATMYRKIIDTVGECILTLDDFSIIIPSGTSIQNARTSFVGDRLTRDGYHLSYNLGRYIAALTWYAAITGAPVADIMYNPAPSEITAEVMLMAKESAENAVKTPLEVTESSYREGKWIPAELANTIEVNPADCFEADLALAATIGINLNDYVIFEYKYLPNTYWYSTKGSGTTTPGASASTYKQNICSAKIYSKTEIPENSLIICDPGWQYRPERWVSLNTPAKTRPEMTTANIALMSADWWGQDKYFAFNIAASPKADISEYYAAAASHIRIYVPKSSR